MTSRERVIATLEFQRVDRIARDAWTLPAAYHGREQALTALLAAYPSDFGDCGFVDPLDEESRFEPGIWEDEWGCVWRNVQRGIIGQVCRPALADWSDLDHWQPPYHLLGHGFERVNETCATTTKFTMLGCANPWERLQALRGSQQAYLDLAAGDHRLIKVLEMIHDYNLRHLEYVVSTDVDSVSLMDDWGSERALLISPQMWSAFFHPLYQDYVDLAHAKEKYVFMHSDGYIMDILEPLVEIGVDAINSQLFVMPIEEIAVKFRGRIAFWGELDRQHILPFGSPGDVFSAVRRVRNAFGEQRGGLIGQAEFHEGYPLENIRAFFEAWWGEPE